MGRYRLVHVGAAALLAAAGVTTFNLAQSVFASGGSSSSFVPTVPCRLVDTRTDSTVGERTTPIDAGETVTFTVTGTNGNCVIPSAATAIATNVTIVNPSASSYLAVLPADADQSESSNLNWQAGSPPLANQVTVGLSADGAIKVFNNAGTVDVIIDVSGYYEPTTALQGTPGPKGDTGPKGDKGDTGAKGDKGDTGDALLASMSCNTDQTIRWDGTAWQCRYLPAYANLDRPQNSSIYGYSGTVYEMFESVSANVDQNYSYCSPSDCQIRLTGVADHASCVATVSSSAYPYGYFPSTYYTTADYIDVYWYYSASSYDSLHVSIACNT